MNKQEITNYFEERLETLADLTERAKNNFLRAQKLGDGELVVYNSNKLAKYTNEYDITETLYAEIKTLID